MVHYLEGKNVNIYIVAETWLEEGDTLNFKNYAICEQSRRDGYAGVAICVKNNITFEKGALPDFEVIYAVALKTTNLEFNLMIVSVYVPANKTSVREDLVL